MLKNYKDLKVFWLIFGISLLFHLAILVLSKTEFSQWSIAHDPFHASIEILGSIIALFVARLLLSLDKVEKGTSFNNIFASALLGMGVFDGVHALFKPGNEFVFFHSIATFWGGVLFSLTWFKDKLSLKLRKRLPYITLILTIVLCILFFVFSNFLPKMVLDGRFTFAAIFLNTVGGILLLLAGLKIILTYKESKLFDDILFFLHCVLFGLAAIMFMESKLWDFSWWGWHILRLLAYITALFFTLALFKKFDLEAIVHHQLKNYERAINEHSIVAKTDLRGVITFVNDMFCEVSGYEREEVIGKTHKIVNSGHHSKDFFQDMWGTIKSGKKWRATIQNKKKNGVYYWVDTTITPIKNLDNEIIEYIAIRTEVTETKTLGDLINELQKLAKIGAWELDLTSGMTTWTDEVYRIHELPIGTPTGKIEAINFYAEHERPRLIQLIKECSEKGVPYDAQFEFFTAKDNHRWIRTIGEPVIIDGNIVKLRGTFQDITRFKLRELELDAAKQKAEVSEKAKTEFLANMSHEIRTPLNGLLGILDVLKQDQLSQDQIELIKIGISSGQSLMRILNDVLDLSKLEFDKLRFESIEFDLVSILNEVMTLLKIEAKKKNLELKLETKSIKEMSLIGDPIRIKQALLNLVSNAIKFTNEGGVYLNLEIVTQSENHLDYKIKIKDTGIGIAKEAHKQLFKSFSQADSSMSRKFGGTGLGLKISKQLIELMGGKISFTSEKNKGSEFTIELSHEKSTKDAGDKMVSTEERVDNKNISNKKTQTILLVEDNKVNQVVAKQMLKKLGYHYEIANDGFEALKKLKNKSFDLVLMDLQMPGIDGLKTTERILSNKEISPSPRVIAMTANTFEEDKENCFKVGMVDFIAKPIDIKSLDEVLKKYTS